jgi:hypothetical protein
MLLAGAGGAAVALGALGAATVSRRSCMSTSASMPSILEAFLAK